MLVETQLIQCAAEVEAIADVSIEKWLYSEMIASAEEALPAVIPDCKSEVAEQVFDTIVTPFFIGVRGLIRRQSDASSRASMRALAQIFTD